MEVENNDENRSRSLPGFQMQVPNLDDKKTAKKFLDIVAKIASLDEVKRAKYALKSRTVKTIFKRFQKMKTSKKEVDALKEIFYTDSDWDEEDDSAEMILQTLDDNDYKDPSTGKISKVKKKHDAELQAAYVILTNRYKEMASLVNDKSSVQKVTRFARSLGRDQIKSKNNKQFISVKLIDNNKDVPLESVNEVLQSLEADVDNKVDVVIPGQSEAKNPAANNSVINEDKEIQDKRKNLADFFRQKKQDKFKKMFDIIAETNSNLTKLKEAMDKLNKPCTEEPNLANSSDFFQQNWKDFRNSNFRNTSFQIDTFIAACMKAANNKDNCMNNGAFLQLAAITISLYHNLADVTSALNKAVDYINSFNKQWVNMAKFGPSGKFKINQRISRNNKAKDHKFSDEQWNKMSYFEKFNGNWKFSDFKQNVPKSWFIKFTDEEKTQYCKKRAEYRSKRIVELAESLKNNEEGIASKIDTFMFYFDRDGYGFYIPSKDVDKSVISQDEKVLLDQFNKVLQEHSKKKLIFNKFRFGDKFLYCNGLSSEEKLLNFKKNRNKNNMNFNVQIAEGKKDQNWINNKFSGKKRKRFNGQSGGPNDQQNNLQESGF